jgi:hypothetical protein
MQDNNSRDIEVTRKQVLGILQIGWATYVERFYCLSPEAQATFLVKQGYARFADVLAHIIAWWEEGQRAIENLLNDPNFNAPAYDVDAFNAQAIERFRGLSDPAVIQYFEETRKALRDLVINLPNDAFLNKKIIERLHIEVVGHLGEHDIP